MLRFLRSKLTAAFATAMLTTSASGADFLWNLNATTGNLNTAGNWAGGAVPPAADPTTNLTFLGLGTPTAVTTTTITNDLATNLNINQMNFQSGLSGAMIITSTGANTFLFNGVAAGINQGGFGAVTFNATSALNLGANTSITGNASGVGNMTFSGIIAVGGNRLTIGNGATGNAQSVLNRVVTLVGQNTYASGGGVTLDGGNLSLTGGTAAANSALGSGAGSSFIVTANGGTLTAGTLVISSMAVPSIVINGPLQIVGTSTTTGQIQLSSATVISGSGNIIIRSASVVALVVQSNSNGYTGTVSTERTTTPNAILAPGTMTINGASGSMTGVPTWNIGAGGTLTASGNVGGVVDRLGNTSDINLRSGNLNINGVNVVSTAYTETVDVLTGTGGFNQVSANPNATGLAFTSLSATSLARTESGTFNFRGTALGTLATGNAGNVTFGTAPSGQIGTVVAGAVGTTTNLKIIPYATADTSATGGGAAFAVYGNLGVRLLAAAETTTVFGGTDNNVRLISSTANATAQTVNSLWLMTAGAVTGTGSIAITSGAIFNNIATGAISNSLIFGSQEAIVHAPLALTISGAMTGTGGFTKSGVGALTLTGDNTGLTGTLALNRGMLILSAVNQLPGTGQIIVNGGLGATSTTNATGISTTVALPITRDIALNSGWMSIITTNATTTTLSGNITGSGSIVHTGNSTASQLSLTGDNSGWTGTIRMFEGFLNVGSNGLGGATLVSLNTSASALNEGLNLLGSVTTSAEIHFADAGYLNTNANTGTLNGPVTGPGTINKTGSGSMIVNAAGTHSGTVAVAGGNLTLAQNGALLSSSYTMSAGTSLTLDNSTAPASQATYGTPARTYINRIADTSAITINAASLTSSGNSSVNLAERLGTVTATGVSTIQVTTLGGMANELHIFNLVASAATLTVRGSDLGAVSGDVARVFLTQFNGVAVTNNQTLGNVMWEDTNNPGTFLQALYSLSRGIIPQQPINVSGTVINNYTPDDTPLLAIFTTTGDATAITGVQIISLTLDVGSTLTLTTGVNGPNGTNNNTPFGTLALSGGSLTSQNGDKTVVAATAHTISLGSGAATITTTSNLTLDANVSLAGGTSLTKLGNGTLTVGGTYSVPGTLAINAGTVALNAGSTIGGLSGTGTLNLAAAGALTINQAATTSFTGTLTNVNTLTKSGVGSLTLTPAAAVSFTGGTTIADGQLVLGNANAAAGIAAGAITFGASPANTSGRLDLNGNNFPGTLTAFPIVGTGVGHQISSTGSAATLNLNFPAATTTAGIAFAGLLTVNKDDANTLILTGTAITTPNLIGGVFNVNAGTLQLNAGGQGIAVAMAVHVANGATFRLNGASTNNSANPWVNVAIDAGGTWLNNGTGFFDTFVLNYTFGGGATITCTAPGTNFYHLIPNGAIAPTITSTAGSTTTVFNAISGDHIQNDGAVPLAITVAQGTTATNIDINFNIAFTSGTTLSVSKLGPGTMALSGFASASNYAWNVNGGRLLAQGTGTGTGAINVNTGGTYGGTGTSTGAITVASGGTLTAGNQNGGTLTLSTTSSSLSFVAGANFGVEISDISMPSTGTPGSSTLGGTPNPTSNNYLNKTAGTTPTGLHLMTIQIDMNGGMFSMLNLTMPYSYVIAGGMGDQSNGGNPLITAPGQFVVTGLDPNQALINLSLSGDASGFLYLNFTPTPEPVLLLVIGGLGLAAAVRRRRAI